MEERRLRILQILYEERERPLQTIGIDELTRLLHASEHMVWNELHYLADKGYISIAERQMGTRIVHFIRITAQGVDVAEGRRLVAPSAAQSDAAPRGELRVFISYSHQDVLFCYRLVDHLRDHLPDSATIFFDHQTLRGGEEYMRVIPEEVEQSNVVIIVLSPQAVASAWVRQETNLALLLAIDHPDRHVIPLVYQDCAIEQLNPFLRIRNVIDCAHQDESFGFDQLIRAMNDF